MNNSGPLEQNENWMWITQPFIIYNSEDLDPVRFWLLGGDKQNG